MIKSFIEVIRPSEKLSNGFQSNSAFNESLYECRAGKNFFASSSGSCAFIPMIALDKWNPEKSKL
jgi:hypothetical protein